MIFELIMIGTITFLPGCKYWIFNKPEKPPVEIDIDKALGELPKEDVEPAKK